MTLATMGHATLRATLSSGYGSVGVSDDGGGADEKGVDKDVCCRIIELVEEVLLFVVNVGSERWTEDKSESESSDGTRSGRHHDFPLHCASVFAEAEAVAEVSSLACFLSCSRRRRPSVVLNLIYETAEPSTWHPPWDLRSTTLIALQSFKGSYACATPMLERQDA
jgi:hypothetical protein